MANKDTSSYVLIAFSPHDSKYATRLKTDLEAQGINTRSEPEEIPEYTSDRTNTQQETPRLEALGETIRNALALLIIASPNTINNQWYIRFAKRYFILIYVIWIEGTELGDTVPSNLRDDVTRVFDARKGHYESALSEIVSELRELLRREEQLSYEPLREEFLEQLRETQFRELLRRVEQFRVQRVRELLGGVEQLREQQFREFRRRMERREEVPRSNEQLRELLRREEQLREQQLRELLRREEQLREQQFREFQSRLEQSIIERIEEQELRALQIRMERIQELELRELRRRMEQLGDFGREEEILRAALLREEQPKEEPLAHQIQFSAFYPKLVTVEKWNTMLVYTHIVSALEAVRLDALRFKDEMGSISGEVHSQSTRPLLRGIEITMVPTCQGVIFNPERIAFKWVEDWQQASTLRPK